jgi:hypothetical protein
VLPASAGATRDLLDFCFDLGSVQLDIVRLGRLLQHAEDAGALRRPVLRAHVDDLRHIQAELAALVTEAERS